MFLGEMGCLLPVLFQILQERYKGKPLSQQKNGVSNGATYEALGQSPTTSPRISRDEDRAPAPVAALEAGPEESEGEALTGAAVGLFFAPALCDVCGTTLVSVSWCTNSSKRYADPRFVQMNVGLLFTPVSIYQ